MRRKVLSPPGATLTWPNRLATQRSRNAKHARLLNPVSSTWKLLGASKPLRTARHHAVPTSFNFNSTKITVSDEVTDTWNKMLAPANASQCSPNPNPASADNRARGLSRIQAFCKLGRSKLDCGARLAKESRLVVWNLLRLHGDAVELAKRGQTQARPSFGSNSSRTYKHGNAPKSPHAHLQQEAQTGRTSVRLDPAGNESHIQDHRSTPTDHRRLELSSSRDRTVLGDFWLCRSLQWRTKSTRERTRASERGLC